MPALEEPPARGRGAIRQGVRTRGGNRNLQNQACLVTKKIKIKTRDKMETYTDQQPNIPDFIRESQINVVLPEAATTLDFLDLLLDNGFFDMSTLQTNLYAA